MADNTLAERIAVLETRIATVENNENEILEQLKIINDSLTQYKGFVGGVAFIVTSVITFLTFAKEWVLAHLK